MSQFWHQLFFPGMIISTLKAEMGHQTGLEPTNQLFEFKLINAIMISLQFPLLNVNQQAFETNQKPFSKIPKSWEQPKQNSSRDIISENSYKPSYCVHQTLFFPTQYKRKGSLAAQGVLQRHKPQSFCAECDCSIRVFDCHRSQMITIPRGPSRAARRGYPSHWHLIMILNIRIVLAM